jgi:hypothetical protein
MGKNERNIRHRIARMEAIIKKKEWAIAGLKAMMKERATGA